MGETFGQSSSSGKRRPLLKAHGLAVDPEEATIADDSRTAPARIALTRTGTLRTRSGTWRTRTGDLDSASSHVVTPFLACTWFVADSSLDDGYQEKAIRKKTPAARGIQVRISRSNWPTPSIARVEGHGVRVPRAS